MLHFDRGGELKRAFLLTAVQRNKNPQLRLRAFQEIAAARDGEAFDLALDEVDRWPRDEKREAVKTGLQALAEKKIGRRDQANAWIWRLAEYSREVHEEYAVQRWPETKRLLGLLVNSSGGAHARNARRLVHAARKQDRRLQAALLAAARGHTPEAEEVLRGARTRLARKPSALSRDLLRNFPKRRSRGSRRRKRKGEAGEETAALEDAGTEAVTAALDDDVDGVEEVEEVILDDDSELFDDAEPAESVPAEEERPEPVDDHPLAAAAAAVEAAAKQAEKPKRARRPRKKVDEDGGEPEAEAKAEKPEEKPK